MNCQVKPYYAIGVPDENAVYSINTFPKSEPWQFRSGRRNCPEPKKACHPRRRSSGNFVSCTRRVFKLRQNRRTDRNPRQRRHVLHGGKSRGNYFGDNSIVNSFARRFLFRGFPDHLPVLQSPRHSHIPAGGIFPGGKPERPGGTPAPILPARAPGHGPYCLHEIFSGDHVSFDQIRKKQPRTDRPAEF